MGCDPRLIPLNPAELAAERVRQIAGEAGGPVGEALALIATHMSGMERISRQHTGLLGNLVIAIGRLTGSPVIPSETKGADHG